MKLLEWFKTEVTGPVLGFVVVRIWLGVRALQTGLEKFGGKKEIETPIIVDGEPNTYGLAEVSDSKTYSFETYNGVPAALRSKFEAEPLIPSWGLDIYDQILGPALLLVGGFLLLGIAPKLTLLAMALLYTSLTFGLILIGQDAGIAWLGIHIILNVWALQNVEQIRLALWNKA
ncbi:MAG: hypothetical protein AAFY98_04070 [Verrucomicrobiota bacterium]